MNSFPLQTPAPLSSAALSQKCNEVLVLPDLSPPPSLPATPYSPPSREPGPASRGHHLSAEQGPFPLCSDTLTPFQWDIPLLTRDPLGDPGGVGGEALRCSWLCGTGARGGHCFTLQFNIGSKASPSMLQEPEE